MVAMLSNQQAEHPGTPEDEGMSPKLQAAIEGGELTADELRELITLEARELGLTIEEAQRKAKLGQLPKNVLGSDIEFLFQLLAA